MRSLADINKIQASLAFLLSAAFRKLFGHGKLVIEHSLPAGYFCHRDDWQAISQEEIEQLTAILKEWISKDTALIETEIPHAEACEKFRKFGLTNKPES